MASLTYTHSSQQLVVAVAGAAGMTFLLFVVMQALLGQQTVPVFRPATEPVSLAWVRPDRPVEQTKRVLPTPPPPAQPPATAQRVGLGGEGPTLVMDPPQIETPSFADNPQTGLQDKAALPLVRIEPKYPVQAARDGIQGWVKLSYSIDSSGQVSDIQVLDAEPKRVFEREAVRALQQWKYQPQMTEGKAVAQHGLVVQLDFALGTE